MVNKKVFIDGSAGTTGLRIYDRLSKRADIDLLILSGEQRKDAVARAAALNSSDIAFLCLPDDASREAVSYIDNPDLVVLDTSTAHRTSAGWVYGFPELSAAHHQHISHAKRIAVPGCHASGFISLVYPLIEAGILASSVRLCCHSLTGYSGGGKSMIHDYQDSGRSMLYDAPRQYGLSQQHKHLKEMVAVCGLAQAPAFCPIVGDFYSGMEVTVPLFKEDLQNGAGIEDIKAVFRSLYTGPLVQFSEGIDEDGFLSAAAFSGKDSMQIAVYGNEERILLVSRFDNLGKGASGAAIECMNIVMGLAPTTGLDV